MVTRNICPKVDIVNDYVFLGSEVSWCFYFIQVSRCEDVVKWEGKKWTGTVGKVSLTQFNGKEQEHTNLSPISVKFSLTQMDCGGGVNIRTKRDARDITGKDRVLGYDDVPVDRWN